MDNTQNLLSTDLQVDTEVQKHLQETAKWAKFLAVVGFIFSAIMLLATISTILAYDDYETRSSYYSRSSQTLHPGVTIFLCAAITAVWFVTSLLTYKFASKMKAALQNTDQLSFNDSLSSLSKNYRFLGIVTIIYLVLIVLLILAAILFSGFSRS